ncbi:olfactory receptor 6Y1-like [Rhinatrema bivittatum]|uniref:olfactory receptor 6Y1-like n=1 Tax=Rhinatrema bivittatum TaxID=194408 RepID=UPI00112CA260|nr:olfactory receptor 6Y1-like [Rhinatrema bivittatum]XP_029435368.1 olfactory receptor 6Y1-like [Rhinatrema bivittatum]
MDRKNSSAFKEFILLGFPVSPNLRILLFLLFLFSYLLTLTSNIIIILLIRLNAQLHKPMYFFLGHLAFLEMWYVTVIEPKMLANFLTQDKTISFVACMTQLYFFLGLACTECVLLAVMAFDRYVAICNPLRYPVILTSRLCKQAAIGSWISGFTIAVFKVYFISGVDVCHSNVINHYFCDVSPLLNLSCSDKGKAEMVDFIFAVIITIFPLIFILTSYIYIIKSVLRIPTTTGRKKAFSTCGSHLTVVIIFFGSTIFIYARPKAIYSFDSNKLVSLSYTTVTPLLNPIIYCFRNNEMKEVWRKTMHSERRL